MEQTATNTMTAPNPLDAIIAGVREAADQLEKYCGDPSALAQREVMRYREHARVSDCVRQLERALGFILIIRGSEMMDTLPPVKQRAPDNSSSASATADAAASPPPASPAGCATSAAGDREAQSNETDEAASAEHPAAPTPAKQPRPAFHPETPSSAWPVVFRVRTGPPLPRKTGRKPSRRELFMREQKARKARLEAGGMRRPFVPRYRPLQFTGTRNVAMRFEAARRVMAGIDVFARRVARRLARIREANRTSNARRYIPAYSEPPDRKNSLGWLYFQPLIAELAPMARTALQKLDTG